MESIIDIEIFIGQFKITAKAEERNVQIFSIIISACVILMIILIVLVSIALKR